MLTSNQARREETRRRAEDTFIKTKQKQEDAQSDRRTAYAAVVAKMARLRALRLAKESLDRNAAARASAEKAQSNAKRVAMKASATNRLRTTKGTTPAGTGIGGARP
jgi:hypothetical protein